MFRGASRDSLSVVRDRLGIRTHASNHDSIRGSRSFKGLTAGGAAIRAPDWACGALIRNLLYLLVMARLNP